ncbi:MAG: TraB/GumN family protein [Flavipsychrobacter sp.]
MKSPIWFFTLLLFAFGFIYSFDTYSQEQEEQSLLWKISSPDLKAPSYLFGTIHMICKDDYVWTKEMQQSLAACKKVCFEMDLDDPSLMTSIAIGMIDASGKQLKDYFKKEDYQKLTDYIADSLGMDITMFQQMKPMALISLFSTQAVTCSTPLAYETEIMKTVSEKGVEIIGLEEAKEQLALFDQMPVDSVIAELLSVINNEGNSVEEYEEMVAAYKRQDINKLSSIIEASRIKGDQIAIFLDNRNIRWIERMTEMMEQSSVFFAVGAGHLVGPNGLITLLRQEGYTLTPIK